MSGEADDAGGRERCWRRESCLSRRIVSCKATRAVGVGGGIFSWLSRVEEEEKENQGEEKEIKEKGEKGEKEEEGKGKRGRRKKTMELSGIRCQPKQERMRTKRIRVYT